MYIDLRDANIYSATVIRLNETAVQGESEVAFAMTGVRKGYYNIFAFIDENDNETWDYGEPNEYAGTNAGGNVWFLENTTGITIEVEQGEF